MPKKIKRVEVQNVVDLDGIDLRSLVVDALQEKKAVGLSELNFKSVLNQPLYDTFIICSATSHTHAEALCENVLHRVYDQCGLEPSHYEGKEQSEWILIDYFNVVVHIFLAEKRQFYDLEGLWNDASITRYE